MSITKLSKEKKELRFEIYNYLEDENKERTERVGTPQRKRCINTQTREEGTHILILFGFYLGREQGFPREHSLDHPCPKAYSCGNPHPPPTPFSQRRGVHKRRAETLRKCLE